MIFCSFCNEMAVYVAVTMDVAWGGKDRLPFCADHLRLYYLGLRYVGGQREA